MPTTVTAKSGEDLRAIVARASDVAKLGEIIGRILESQAQRSFVEQRLGEFVWPERYPFQEDPFVNIASLVNWTNDGGEINSRFFDRRPALMATGGLAGSISARTKGKETEVGSKLPYAANPQWGIASTQTITPAAKGTIAKFIGEESDGSGGWRKKKNPGARQKENREKFWFKLFPILGLDELETQPVQRPFLGITPQNASDMQADLEFYVKTGDE